MAMGGGERTAVFSFFLKFEHFLAHRFADFEEGGGVIVVAVGARSGGVFRCAEEWAGIDGGGVRDGFGGGELGVAHRGGVAAVPADGGDDDRQLRLAEILTQVADQVVQVLFVFRGHAWRGGVGDALEPEEAGAGVFGVAGVLISVRLALDGELERALGGFGGSDEIAEPDARVDVLEFFATDRLDDLAGLQRNDNWLLMRSTMGS